MDTDAIEGTRVEHAEQRPAAQLAAGAGPRLGMACVLEMQDLGAHQHLAALRRLAIDFGGQ
jgi:hypothetical protein